MGIYAAFGFALALFTFIGSYNLYLSGLRASLTLFKRALTGVMRSPVLYHDSTPIGRIISRLSKGMPFSPRQDHVNQIVIHFF